VRCCATLTAEGSGEIPLLNGPAAAAAAKEEEKEEEVRTEPGPPLRLDGDSCDTN
jgi:hypothetical protein